MVRCSCGKVIDRLPEWLSSVKVQFVCTNCPNRDVKSIAHVSLEIHEEQTEEHTMPEDAENGAEEQGGDE